MWEADRNALTITCGAELEKFDLGSVRVNDTDYTVLTGYEGQHGRCYWCGGQLKGKLKRYCRGHMKEYYKHFEWGYASAGARRRSGYKCENCGEEDREFYSHPTYSWQSHRTNLEVHHIIPLEGNPRFFSAYNLPFNLIVLCHKCHLELHAVMRPMPAPALTRYEKEIAVGQLPLSAFGVRMKVMETSDCPDCHKPGYWVLEWEPPEGLDPKMIAVRCVTCEQVTYVVPGKNGHQPRRNASLL